MAFGISFFLKGGRQAAREVDTVTNSVERLAKAKANAANRAADKAYNTQRQAAFRDTRGVRAVGRAAALGSIPGAGSIAAALGAPTKGLMALGLGLAAVTAVMGAFGDAIKRAEDHARQVAEGQLQLSGSIRDAIKNADSTALGFGKQNRGSIAALAASGNLDRAQAFARTVGEGGLGAAGTLQKSGMFTETNLRALQLAAQTQQLDPDKGASLLAGNRALASGTAEEIARALIVKSGGSDVGNVSDFIARLGATPAGAALAATTSAEGNLAGVSATRFLAGGTQRGLQQDASAVAAPEAVARGEFNRIQAEQLSVLKTIADQQGLLARIWLNFTSTDGSAQVRFQRAQNVTDALGVPST